MPRFSFKRSSAEASPSSEPLNETNGKGLLKKKMGSNKSKRGGRRSSSPIRPTSIPVNEVKGQSKPRQQTKKPNRFKRSSSRKGATCCGYCDMRIATSLLNIVHMIGAIARELIEASKWGNRNYFYDPPVLLLLAIGISGLGLVGSLRFSNFHLIVSSFCLPFLCYLYVGESYMFLMAIAIMLFFAQIGLASEIRRGIMSEETYAREEYIDESGKVMYTTVQDKATEITDAACDITSNQKNTIEL
eukprot:CAMPEP_0116126772 /NCGR_PEP_ID=MMETSP0329-20121206/6502_1 /TAXON_ID=697910 /ORGANISM="Pseudo-nitzschia arenysensis, Strain B593" /LENGTH=244 /DNA_ID=CAMNT_0003620861 /DNA_START=27 /DNA_END=761 /DNA_ORIENTATION=-